MQQIAIPWNSIPSAQHTLQPPPYPTLHSGPGGRTPAELTRLLTVLRRVAMEGIMVVLIWVARVTTASAAFFTSAGQGTQCNMVVDVTQAAQGTWYMCNEGEQEGSNTGVWYLWPPYSDACGRRGCSCLTAPAATDSPCCAWGRGLMEQLASIPLCVHAHVFNQPQVFSNI